MRMQQPEGESNESIKARPIQLAETGGYKGLTRSNRETHHNDLQKYDDVARYRSKDDRTGNSRPLFSTT